MSQHQLIGLGGSFDHFHLGHEAFLLFAARHADTLLIGVTTPELTKHKPFARLIQDWRTRVQSVKRFCENNTIKHQIVELSDVFGPTLKGSQVDALAVTTETVSGASAINHRRQDLHLPMLPTYVCDLVPDQAGDIIHSARIRAGLINRRGEVYASILNKNLVFSAAQKAFFSAPQGEIWEASLAPEAALTCVVGDSTLEHFISQGWQYNLGVFDKRRQREIVTSEIIDKLAASKTISNNPGSISLDLTLALKAILAQLVEKPNETYHININGEEDLATVALVLLLPLGAHLYYGQPNQGIVHLQITEELKDRFFTALAH